MRGVSCCCCSCSCFMGALVVGHSSSGSLPVADFVLEATGGKDGGAHVRRQLWKKINTAWSATFGFVSGFVFKGMSV